MKILLIFTALIGVTANFSRADDGQPQPGLHERWRQVYRSIAEGIEMRCSETPLMLHTDALLAYTNPVRETDQHGVIYLWTDRGRPAVFGSIWSAISRTDPSLRNITHEWHSLVDVPGVKAIREGQPLWLCNEPGIEWQQPLGSSAVASSRVARLVQMRRLVRRLSTTIESNESELRLISQPLYRYPEMVEGAIDGAIFTFAMGTDPEVLVLIEAYEEKSQPAWRLAFARFGAQPMTVRDGDQLIWSCGEAVPAQRNLKYHLHYRAGEMPAAIASDQ